MNRSKAYLFEEFLSSWYEKLKSEEPTTMTVRLQKDIDKYKVCITATTNYQLRKLLKLKEQITI